MVYSASLKAANEARHQAALAKGSRKARATNRKRANHNTVVPTSPPVAQAPAAPVKVGLRRYALVYDMSGSMNGRGTTWGARIPSHAPGAIAMAAALKDRLIHEDKDGRTLATVVVFGSNVEVGQRNYKPKGLKDISQWPDMGGTALYDAIVEAAEAIEKDAGPDDTFCVITVTDGEENESRKHKHDFVQQLQRRQATDRWTFVFNLPPGKARNFASLTGLPQGNMQEWSDIGEVSQTVADGISAYSQAVARGATSVSNFLLKDPLDVKDLVNCPDVKDKVKVWQVDKTVKISEFVRSHGVEFEIGKGYYQFTKPEKVEAGKGMLAIEKTFNPTNGSKTVEKVFSEVRPILQAKMGLPDGEIRKLIPGNLGNVDLFIQSTSDNRNLLPGTRLVYFVK